jgi:fructokinase
VICVVGEALVDVVVSADGHVVGAHVGGGPFTTARALARLGADAAFVGALSTDAFGRRLRAALTDDGVDLTWAVATPEPTTLALAELDERGSATYHFYLDGTSAVGPAAAGAVAAVAGRWGTVQVLHVGTLGLAVPPLAEAVEALVTSAPPEVLVVVDPNVRPALLDGSAGGALAARWRERWARVLERADVVKASVEDLAWMSPGLEVREAAGVIVAAGPSLVVVTAGAHGAIVYGQGFERTVPARATMVADTIGAGDAFGAGLVAWWVEHDKPDLGRAEAAEAAAAFAASVAAVTVSRPGADPPHRHELPTPTPTP